MPVAPVTLTLLSYLALPQLLTQFKQENEDTKNT